MGAGAVDLCLVPRMEILNVQTRWLNVSLWRVLVLTAVVVPRRCCCCCGGAGGEGRQGRGRRVRHFCGLF